MASPYPTSSVKPQSKTFVLFFLLLSLSPYPTSSSPHKLSYKDHCQSIVPHATLAGRIVDPSTYISLSNGYLSGGDDLLKPNELPSAEAASSLSSLPSYFYFHSQSFYITRTPGVVKFDGSLTLAGRATAYTNSSRHRHRHRHRRRRRWHNVTNVGYNNRNIIDFQLSGFWSKPAGKICMVGSGYVTTKKGTTLHPTAVFKLNYPHTSNISTSLVNGTVESLDSKDSPAHFKPLSILAYGQNNYSYTKIPNARDACSHFNVREELLGLGDSYTSSSTCNYLQDLFNNPFKLEYGEGCSVLNCNLLGFKPTFMSFNQLGCAENGKVHMYIGFSMERDYDYRSAMVPDKSLVGEGLWDPEKKRLCVVAFPISIRKNSPVDASVSDAAFGISLWFPGVLTLERRSTIAGRIWSEKESSRNISFRSLKSNRGFLPGVRYEYTRTQYVSKSCKRVGKVGNGRYPDGNVIGDLRFDIKLTDDEGFSTWGSAIPLSLGENFYGDSYGVSNTALGPATATLEEMTPVLLNVSYKLSYYIFNKSSQGHKFIDISAEGIYNTGTGAICMVGCRDKSNSEQMYRNSDSSTMDCNISISIQLAPMNPGDENVTYPGSWHLNGTIRSSRTKEDPLYFKPQVMSSYNIYASTSTRETWRMNIEIIMVLVSLTFLCIFIVLQLFHIRRHREMLPSISITMLVILTLGLVTPLVLNFEALFFMNRGRHNVLLWSGGWIEVNEVIVRFMTLLAFLLQFWLLQSVWNARSSEDNEKSVGVAERKALRFCLPLYFFGALIAWFVHTRSHQTPPESPSFVVVELYNHSIWDDLMSYGGLILDSFLLPQIILNMIGNCTDKALSPFYYVGITVVRALPHVYDTYRAHYYVPSMDSSIIFGRRNEDLYSSAWDFIIPLGGVLFAVLIFFQQRFGGGCFLPKRFRNHGGYEMVPVVIP